MANCQLTARYWQINVRAESKVQSSWSIKRWLTSRKGVSFTDFAGVCCLLDFWHKVRYDVMYIGGENGTQTLLTSVKARDSVSQFIT